MRRGYKASPDSPIEVFGAPIHEGNIGRYKSNLGNFIGYYFLQVPSYAIAIIVVMGLFQVAFGPSYREYVALVIGIIGLIGASLHIYHRGYLSVEIGIEEVVVRRWALTDKHFSYYDYYMFEKPVQSVYLGFIRGGFVRTLAVSSDDGTLDVIWCINFSSKTLDAMFEDLRARQTYYLVGNS